MGGFGVVIDGNGGRGGGDDVVAVGLDQRQDDGLRALEREVINRRDGDRGVGHPNAHGYLVRNLDIINSVQGGASDAIRNRHRTAGVSQTPDGEHPGVGRLGRIRVGGLNVDLLEPRRQRVEAAANKDIVYPKAIPRSVGVIKHVNPEGDVAGDLREGRSQRNAHLGIRVTVKSKLLDATSLAKPSRLDRTKMRGLMPSEFTT